MAKQGWPVKMGRGEFRVSVDISSSGSGGSLVGGGTGVTKGKERLSMRPCEHLNYAVGGDGTRTKTRTFTHSVKG